MLKIKKIKDSYLLELPQTYRGYYLVNGQKVESGKINLIEEPDSIYLVISGSVPDYYYHTKSDSKLSISEYNEQREMLKNKGYYEDYDREILVFDDVADEITYKRFLQEWKLQSKEEETRTQEEYEIINLEDSPNPYIRSYRTIGKGLEPLFDYSPHPVAMFKEIATKFGFTEVPDQSFKSNTAGRYYSIPTHSGIEYVKMNDKYLFTGGNKITFYGITGTYQECEARFNSDYQKIHDVVKKAYLVLENKELSDLQTKWVIEILTHLKDHIYKIDPMKKSYKDLRDLQTYISAQLKKFIDVQS